MKTVWFLARQALRAAAVAILVIAFFIAQGVGIRSPILWMGIALAALVFGMAVVPRYDWPLMFRRHVSWASVGLGVVSYPMWLQFANGSDIEAGFFEVTAQVIPVLLLAALVDVSRSRTLSSNALLMPVVAGVLGEVAALDAVAFGPNDGQSFAAVSSALVAVAVALVFAVLADVAEDDD